MGERDDHADVVRFESPVGGVGDVPTVLAFSALAGWRWFALLVVGIPLALLGASLWLHAGVAEVLFGVPALLGMAFWWSSYRYVEARATIDPGRRTLKIDHAGFPWRATQTKTVDLDDVAGVSIVSIGDAATIRLAYDWTNVFSPPDVAVGTADLRAAVDALRKSGVDVATTDHTPLSWRSPSEPLVQVVAIWTALVGVPLVGVVLYGPGILIASNAAIIAWVMAIWTGQRHVRARASS